MPRLIVWFVLGAAVVGAVAGLLGAGPERLRALLLFPVAFGALVGGGLGFAARESGVRPGWLVVGLSCLLVSGGLLVVAWEAFRQLDVMAKARVREDPTQLLGLQMLEEQRAVDPTYERQYREQRMALDPEFEDYLMGRVSALGIWRSPWPMVVWLAEVLLATIAGGWIARRMTDAIPATGVGTGPRGAVESEAESAGEESENPQ